MTISIIKIAAVIIILAMMIVLLLSVNHFMRGDFTSNQDEIDLMRKELDDSEQVISEQSVFKEIVDVSRNRSVVRQNAR